MGQGAGGDVDITGVGGHAAQGGSGEYGGSDQFLGVHGVLLWGVRFGVRAIRVSGALVSERLK